MALFEWFITDTMSGVIQTRIYPVPDPVKKAVNEVASNQTSLPIDASPFTAAELEQLTKDWSRTIIVRLNKKTIYNGIIQDFDWEESTGLLTLMHEDYRCIFGGRTTLGSNGYSGDQETANNLILNNIALEAVPPWLVWSGTYGPTANYDLPIFIEQGKITLALLGSLVTPGSFSFEYWDHEFPFIEEQFGRLQALGLEIDFEPRTNSAGNEELLQRAGKLTGGSFDLNLTQPKCPISNLRVRRNAQRQANVMYSVGKGSERSMKVTTSRAEPTGPALELAESFKEIDDPVKLQAHSDENLRTLSKPVVQWEFDLPIDFGPGIENIRFGSAFRIYSKRHPIITDGWHEMRYIGFDIDPATELVRMTVQPDGDL